MGSLTARGHVRITFQLLYGCRRLAVIATRIGGRNLPRSASRVFGSLDTSLLQVPQRQPGHGQGLLFVIGLSCMVRKSGHSWPTMVMNVRLRSHA
jgi:hypothetical protein